MNNYKNHTYENTNCPLNTPYIPAHIKSKEEWEGLCVCPEVPHVCIAEQQKQQIIHDACTENKIYICICVPCKEEAAKKDREHMLMKAETKGFMEGYMLAKGDEFLKDCISQNWVAKELGYLGITPPPCAEWPLKNEK